ncbi:MAG: hypothetical protein U0175_13155 [Caldilineaceae bacterium]
MFHKLSTSALSKRLAPFAIAGAALVLITASASADARCRNVHGFYEEHAADPTSCPSPVGLCIAGEYSGSIKGLFTSTATTLTTTIDTPLTTVVDFTGDSVIHAKIGNKQGDLMVKNAGVYQTTGDGNILDLQYITSGTGQLVGASGVIRASGMFNPATGMGESEYEGMVCLP